MLRMIHSLARRAVRVLMRSDRLWEWSQRISGSDFYYRQRYAVIHKRARRSCAAYLDSLQVLGGPFEGMKYDRARSIGSSLWPKLLGTYESELWSCFQLISRRGPYRAIIDIGFAEGYYLIGFGRRFPEACLIGFDSQPEAQDQCRANARSNAMEQGRLHLHGAFESELFQRYLETDSLVIVDCEGVENEVISGLTKEQTQRADWLIETHDHLIEGTTERIMSVLNQTHDLIEVSTDRHLRAKCRLLPESIRQSCDHYVQEALVCEGRPARQSWILATRRAA